MLQFESPFRWMHKPLTQPQWPSGGTSRRIACTPRRIAARRVLTESIAILRTTVADLRTHFADARVMRGPNQRETHAGIADLRARTQHPHVIGFGVLSLELEAMTDRLQTRLLAA